MIRIRPNYDRTEAIQGVKYDILYTKPEIVVLRVLKLIQFCLWFCGVAWHDPVFNKCTPDFNCCANVGRKAWIKFPKTN